MDPLGVLAAAVVLLLLAAYFWFRFGPLRCPRCGRWTFGYAGTPVGIRWMHFHCRKCGTRFSGHPRLPL